MWPARATYPGAAPQIDPHQIVLFCQPRCAGRKHWLATPQELGPEVIICAAGTIGVRKGSAASSASVQNWRQTWEGLRTGCRLGAVEALQALSVIIPACLVEPY